MPVATFPLSQSTSLTTALTVRRVCVCVFREGLQQWDEVEFIGIRDLGVAVAVNAQPKKVKEVSRATELQ